MFSAGNVRTDIGKMTGWLKSSWEYGLGGNRPWWQRAALLALLLLFPFLSAARAGEDLRDHFFTISYSRARPQAMGGAFAAVQGGLEAAFYNPATFQLTNLNRGKKLSFFANPLASAVLYQHYSQDGTKKLGQNEWWNVLSVFPKAIFFSTPTVEAGLISLEELETREAFHPNRDIFEVDHFFEHHFETAVIKVRLAEQVSLGATLSHYAFMTGDSVETGLGASYGVYIQPNRYVGVGVVFIDLPDQMRDLRLRWDRFEGKTVNMGISFRPFRMTTLSLDVRNLTEDNLPNTRELHIGVEQGLWRHLYLRTGYYRDAVLPRRVVTAGIGLFNLSFSAQGERRFDVPVLALNYALQVESGVSEPIRRHFLSFNWGF